MRRCPWLTPVIIGVGVLAGASVAALPVVATPECEKNVCILATGNCDVSLLSYNCKETTGGYGCAMSAC